MVCVSVRAHECAHISCGWNGVISSVGVYCER